MKLIKCVVCDIDGVITAKSIGAPIDLFTVHQIQRLNQQSKTDPAIPFITLNSGRPLAYMEVIAQAVGTDHYFIFEVGAGIARIDGPKMIIHRDPRMTNEYLEQLHQFVRNMSASDEELRIAEQPTKYFSGTFLFEPDSPRVKHFARILQEVIDKEHLPFDLDIGHNFINIINPGVDKATGLQLFLNYEKDLTAEELAGIGDSDGDWVFLSKCGLAACPSNASPKLRSVCDYVANLPETQGTLEIIHHIIERNRTLLREQGLAKN
jgi:hydroxymethylpyrimidine pyrophosphatase-like HAD family hydrolase